MTTEKKFPLPTAQEENIEEALGVIWHQLEDGQSKKQTLLPMIEEVVGKEIYAQLLSQNLAREEKDEVKLTANGENLAKQVIRRHRLAERLLTDVLQLPSEVTDPNACKLEHILSAEVADSICSLLGHPKQCPHGHKIPAGRCCEQVGQKINPIIHSLDQMKAGEKGKIAYLLLENHPDLHRLLALGLVPGTQFNLHQVYPTFVLEIGETTLALSEEIAQKIFVRQNRN